MIRVALAQIDPRVGDIEGNLELISSAIRRAAGAGAQVAVLPELAVTGYPPEDLVLKRAFVKANRKALERIATVAPEVLTVVGFVDSDDLALYNAAGLCVGGRVAAVYRKQLLPNYGVFDERRYFEPGTEHVLLQTAHGVIGVCVCEDAWRADGPVCVQGDAGAQVVLNINASPFQSGKLEQRTAMLADRATRADASVVYVNTVGGQDELVFDGGSMVVSPQGELIARLPQFVESFAVVDVPLGDTGDADMPGVRRITVELTETSGDAPGTTIAAAPDETAEIYGALCLALRDYAAKNGFERAVIGLSGGIDSSLTATIAADALGAEAVTGVSMPSDISSSHSVDDAKALAANLGIGFVTLPIAPTYNAYLRTMEGAYGHAEPGIAEENLQARIRGNLLMATSNRYGHLVLATGNKSELACGYTTLYGDMAGGFALLKDVFKTDVYRLARYRNERSSAIPESVLEKPPSAELRPGQKDSDSLPPYDVLDAILEDYIENDAGVADMIAAGHDEGTVRRVVAMVDAAEYKRRQAPPGPKVTTKAFGRDRRLPITNLWRQGEVDLPAKVVGEKRHG